MADPIAEPSDVDPAIIATDLDASEIQPHLDYAARKIGRVTNPAAMSNDDRLDLEAHLAALRIRQISKDRALAEGSGESTSVVFEGSSIEFLRGEIADLDPSGELVETDEPEFYFEAH